MQQHGSGSIIIQLTLFIFCLKYTLCSEKIVRDFDLNYSPPHQPLAYQEPNYEEVQHINNQQKRFKQSHPPTNSINVGWPAFQATGSRQGDLAGQPKPNDPRFVETDMYNGSLNIAARQALQRQYKNNGHANDHPVPLIPNTVDEYFKRYMAYDPSAPVAYKTALRTKDAIAHAGHIEIARINLNIVTRIRTAPPDSSRVQPVDCKSRLVKLLSTMHSLDEIVATAPCLDRMPNKHISITQWILNITFLSSEQHPLPILGSTQLENLEPKEYVNSFSEAQIHVSRWLATKAGSEDENKRMEFALKLLYIWYQEVPTGHPAFHSDSDFWEHVDKAIKAYEKTHSK